MDSRMVKKYKKRKDLDKLLVGNARKHFRKKSGHILLKTESQSSTSSDDLENFNQYSTIHFKGFRCSSCILYASICLSICTLILSCVLFGLTLISRSHINLLQSEVQIVSQTSKSKATELQEIYSRLQTLQIYVHQLNRNITKQNKLFRDISDRFEGLRKRFRKFEGFETLLGSLSNVPTRIQEIKSTNDRYDQSEKELKDGLNQANQRINDLTSRITATPKKKKIDPVTEPKQSSQLSDNLINHVNAEMDILRRNVSDLQRMILLNNRTQVIHIKDVSEKDNKSSQNRTTLNRLDALGSELLKVKTQLQEIRYQNNFTRDFSMTSAFQNLRMDIEKNKKTIDSIRDSIRHASSVKDPLDTHHGLQVHQNDNDVDIEYLNSTLAKLVDRIPKVRLTLGFGVSDNATFKREPLGHGVILRRDEYFKLRSYWAKASTSFTLSIQSQQRVKVLEKKFNTLKRQVIDSIKDLSVLEAVGLKPTDKPGGKNRPEMEINVPIPVYTTPRDPNAPTPDPHLKLPWVKTARDAEINFLRWNRNGDDALSGEELDPAALRGFMGPYTPTLEQMMHYDVNNDHRLQKNEVLCLFGYIPWPCTGDVITAKPIAASENAEKAEPKADHTDEIDHTITSPTTVTTQKFGHSTNIPLKDKGSSKSTSANEPITTPTTSPKLVKEKTKSTHPKASTTTTVTSRTETSLHSEATEIPFSSTTSRSDKDKKSEI